MCAAVRRPWWSRLCSICFVISIALPTTAPFQVVGVGEALRFGQPARVATPGRPSSGHAVTNQAGVPSLRGQEGRRHRAGSVAKSRTSMVDRPLCPTPPRLDSPGFFRPTDQQLTVLRI